VAPPPLPEVTVPVPPAEIEAEVVESVLEPLVELVSLVVELAPPELTVFSEVLLSLPELSLSPQPISARLTSEKAMREGAERVMSPVSPYAPAVQDCDELVVGFSRSHRSQ